MSRAPSPNPLVQQLDLLLTGYGYNCYDKKNGMRADDLLVRQKAAASLDDAARALAVLQAEYQRRYIPPASRETPYPPPQRLERLREIEGTRQRVSALSAEIRGMPVPTQDKTWWRFRQEQALLDQLLRFDLELVELTDGVARHVGTLSAVALNDDDPAAALESLLGRLETAIRGRRQFLQIPT